MSRTCGFEGQTEKMIRDQFVFHSEHPAVLEKLMTPRTDGTPLTLDKAYRTAIVYETTQAHLKAFPSNGRIVTGTVTATKRHGARQK